MTKTKFKHLQPEIADGYDLVAGFIARYDKTHPDQAELKALAEKLTEQVAVTTARAAVDDETAIAAINSAKTKLSMIPFRLEALEKERPAIKVEAHETVAKLALALRAAQVETFERMMKIARPAVTKLASADLVDDAAERLLQCSPLWKTWAEIDYVPNGRDLNEDGRILLDLAKKLDGFIGQWIKFAE